MKILYYDCPAGISGDMNLAAMIDLGVDPDSLRAQLSQLGLDAEFELRVSRAARNGLHGTRVDVVLKNTSEEAASTEAVAPATAHSHHAHDGEHGHGHPPAAAHHHQHAPHRHLADIAALIEQSGLDPAIRRTALAIFHKIATAEAKVHGTTIDKIHFHEVGATDSLVDIVGAAICAHDLGVDAIWASPLELGGGFVRCAHGVIPVPAPATVEILHGIPTTRGAVGQETTTPTGAAIVAVLASRFTATPALITEKTGYGIGHREMDIPNLLRVHLAQTVETQAGDAVAPAKLLQCNIDDMTAEMLGVVMETLMEAGAMDVHFTPILMKKNRPATCLSLLCAPADEEHFKDLLFRHTTTLGLKSFTLEKTVLETSFERLDTPLGPVTMKNALRGGVVLRSKPELEDCRELAKRHDLPLTEVYARIGKYRK